MRSQLYGCLRSVAILKVETPGSPPWGRSKPSQVHSCSMHYTEKEEAAVYVSVRRCTAIEWFPVRRGWRAPNCPHRIGSENGDTCLSCLWEGAPVTRQWEISALTIGTKATCSKTPLLKKKQKTHEITKGGPTMQCLLFSPARHTLKTIRGTSNCCGTTCPYTPLW